MATLKNGNGTGVTWEGIKAWLPVVLLILGLAVGWGVASQRINTMECDIAELQTRVAKTDVTLLQISKDIVAIQTDIAWIRKALETNKP